MGADNGGMAVRLFAAAVRHQAPLTCAFILALLFNLLVVVHAAPATQLGSELPVASHCQGASTNCAQAPMIAPPAIGGAPKVESVPAAVFSRPLPIEPKPLAAVIEAPPRTIDRPPALPA